MSATLVVSATRSGASPNARGSILLRIQPEEGRTIERPLVGGTESINVPAGQGSLQAIFSSGQVHAQTYSVADGDKLPISIAVPGSPHESMAWLSLSRDPSRAAPTRPRSRSGMRLRFPNGLETLESPSKGEQAALPDFELLGASPRIESVVVQTITRDASRAAVIATDRSYPEARVCHLQDGRDVGCFRGSGGSALALLQIVHSEHPDLVRLAALPGPLGVLRSSRETHVALRTVEGDPLPDMQIVPADADLAPVVGFLERGNQRALGVLQDGLVAWAHDAMSEKVSDPIAAAIGMAVLLRLGRQQTVSGWSANLWQWFPALPDGGALHAAVLTQQEAGDVEAWHTELRKAVLGACRAGMPLLSDCVRHLRAALNILRGAEQIDPEVQAASAWCSRLARAMDADSVFTTLTLKSEDQPLVWGFGR